MRILFDVVGGATLASPAVICYLSLAGKPLDSGNSIVARNGQSSTEPFPRRHLFRDPVRDHAMHDGFPRAAS